MRADRLMAIMMHLQSKGKMTAKELAKLLEVSERTIYRDIDALCAAGVPITAESGLGGGFSLPPDYRTKVDGLRTSEIHALFLQMNELPFRQLGFNRPLQSALSKIFHSLPGQLRHDAEWVQNRVFLDTGGWRPKPDDTALVRRMQKAVWEQIRVRLTYRDRLQTDYRWTADPYGLVLKSGMWFLVVRTDEGFASLRAARILEFELTDRTFDRLAEFNLEQYWKIWVEHYERRTKRYEVWLRTDGDGLAALAGSSGAVVDQASIREAEQGRKDVRAFFESAAGAAAFATEWAAHVEAVAPQPLRDLLAERAARLLAVYERADP